MEHFSEPIRFHSGIVRGAGRGRMLSVPTLNLDLTNVPDTLRHGVYACFVELPGHKKLLRGAMHYGPRPVFRDSVSCEIHLLDSVLVTPPENVGVMVIARIRDVQNFPTSEALVARIQEDIRETHAILDTSGFSSKEEATGGQ